MIAVGKILNVSAYDWGWYAQHLFAFLVKLKETFGTELVARLVALQMSDNWFACKKVLLLLLIEYFEIILVKLRKEENIYIAFWHSDKAESCSCFNFFTIICSDMYW